MEGIILPHLNMGQP